MGLEEGLQAMLWSGLVAVSLPLGAMAGLLASPVSPRTIAGCMAFGAGALIFAVAIELYSEQIGELRSGGTKYGRWEVVISAIATMVSRRRRSPANGSRCDRSADSPALRRPPSSVPGSTRRSIDS